MVTWEALRQKDTDEVFAARITLSFAEVIKDFEDFTRFLINCHLND